jgi:hypothetical protein
MVMRVNCSATPRENLQRQPRPCPFTVHFLDFLRGLPEKQIGTNRGAKHRNDQQQVIIVQRDSWQNCSDKHLPPWDLYREGNSHIKKQHERKTFQNWGVAVVWHEHL